MVGIIHIIFVWVVSHTVSFTSLTCTGPQCGRRTVGWNTDGWYPTATRRRSATVAWTVLYHTPVTDRRLPYTWHAPDRWYHAGELYWDVGYHTGALYRTYLYNPPVSDRTRTESNLKLQNKTKYVLKKYAFFLCVDKKTIFRKYKRIVWNVLQYLKYIEVLHNEATHLVLYIPNSATHCLQPGPLWSVLG